MTRILGGKKLYLEQSGYEQALFLENFFGCQRAGLLAWISSTLAVTFGFLTILILDKKSLAWLFLGACEIFLGLFFLSLVYFLFTTFLQRDHHLTFEEVKRAWDHEAYGRGLTFSAAKIFVESATEQDLLLVRFFNTLLKNRRICWALKRFDLAPEDFAKDVADFYPSGAALPLSEVLRLAWQKAIAANHLTIEYSDLLMAVYELDKIFQKILFDYELEEEDMREVCYWQRRQEIEQKMCSRFWEKENLLNIKGLGKNWSAGYTFNLDQVARDLTEDAKFQKAPFHLYGHRSQIEILERMLVRIGGTGNVVLVGQPGVGRHTLVRALAARLNAGKTLGPLRYLRLLQIDTSAVIAGTRSLNEVVEKIQILFTEAALAENVILVINDFDALLDPQPEAGRVNATEALLPYLQSPLRTIGLMTLGGWQATIGKNPMLERLVSKLEVSEPSEKQTLLILEDEVKKLESQSRLFFTHGALKEIVKLTSKLIQSLPNPEKSLEILEESAVYVATKTPDRAVLPEHVQKVVSLRTKVPVEKIGGQEKDILLNLETILHERIVGQNEAISELANALRRARSGIASEKRPIGSFLFLGPTGVGKTETTKVLAAVYFGSEKRIVRFDMSEFQEVHSINRLIGDADIKTGGLLTEAVITSPFSLILLDELEKAHPKVLDLFLQVFDEGRLTDIFGRTVSFTNSMIIATSNAGAEKIRQMVREGRNPAALREELLDSLQRQGIFHPEFLNRFDAVVIYRPLSPQELTQVAGLLLAELNERLTEKDIEVAITPALAEAVAQGGYSPEFGARPLRRYIQERIENYIAKGLLSGEIKRGQVVEPPLELFQNKT